MTPISISRQTVGCMLQNTGIVQVMDVHQCFIQFVDISYITMVQKSLHRMFEIMFSTLSPVF